MAKRRKTTRKPSRGKKTNTPKRAKKRHKPRQAVGRPTKPGARRTARRKAAAGRSPARRIATGARGRPTVAIVRARLTPRQAVYRALADLFGNLAITDSTKLKDLGFDRPALAALAARIRAYGVPVDTAAVQMCTTVGDVVKVAEKAARGR